MSDHPSHELLSRYLAGRTSKDESQLVEQHIVDCDECTNQLGQISARENTFEVKLAQSAKSHQSTARQLPEIAVGTVIDKYVLRELLGEGGMGQVWQAEQTSPVTRTVAIKLVKSDLSGRHVLARFEAERQALTLMDHPNIAKVLDAGTTKDGSPYFVMELVKGVPITIYCDSRRLAPTERLELFVSVCQAIQHAHQKGIIHRDIKPTNVLVAMYDERPVVKVIDFGVAKAVSGTLTELTLDTGIGGLIGTPEYMSPEQATLNNVDIDSRSDVYALGILLYELLTGVLPFTRKELEKKGILEMLRVVREEEPPRPSTKLSTANALPTISANRGTEPKKLTGLLRSDLDWIVMKAIEKDRNRRYETANGFAADVLRYLGGEPVTAHPPNGMYRLKKFVRRNKLQVLASAAVILSLVAGVIGTTWQAINAELARADEFKQRKRAEQKEQEANLERAKAIAAAEHEQQARRREAERAEAEKKAKLEAIKNLAFAKRANEILGSIFTDLDPTASYSTISELTQALKKNLKKASEELEGTSVGDPLTVAAMQNIVGTSFFGLGDPNQAIVLFEKSLPTFRTHLGADQLETLKVMNNLAASYQAAGRMQKALLLHKETLQLQQAKLGPDHPETLTAMSNLAESYRMTGNMSLALPLFEKTSKLMLAKLGNQDRRTLTAMSNLATIYYFTNNVVKAVPLFEETLKLTRAHLGTSDPLTLTTMNNLAQAYTATGKSELALPLMEETLRLRKDKLGPDHADTLATQMNLAVHYGKAGRLNLAVPLLEEAYNVSKGKQGLDHPGTLTIMASLATGYYQSKKFERALALQEEAWKLQKKNIGADHPNTLMTMASLARSYKAVGKLDLAISLWEETLKLQRAKLGVQHPVTQITMNDLANGYESAGKLESAFSLWEEGLKLKRTKLGADHPETLNSLNTLAVSYWQADQFTKSVPLFEELLVVQTKKFGRNHPSTQTTVANLGVNYKDAGRFTQAIPLLKEAYSFSKSNAPLRWVGPQLLDAFAKASQANEAAALVSELLSTERSVLAKESPELASKLASFGTKLVEAKAYKEAEPLLREALTIGEKKEPEALTTFATMSTLGASMLAQKKFADAEPLLLKGYEGMKSRSKSSHPGQLTDLRKAIDRLIDLYTGLSKPDQVKKWQTELSTYPNQLPGNQTK